MTKARLISGLIVLLLTATTAANAQEWTQWRGPARDGSVTDKNVPAAWPESLKRSWRGEIGEAREAFPLAAQTLRMLAGNIGDEELREGFLSAPRARRVLAHDD